MANLHSHDWWDGGHCTLERDNMSEFLKQRLTLYVAK